MANAKKDGNSVSTLIAVSSVDGVTPVLVYADPITHRLLVDSAAGSGTVTSVSVTSANGFAGTVATATTTPAITLSTTVTGIIKGNGTAISAATDGTDYLSSSTGVLLSNVTTTATASKVVQRDSNANIFVNNFFGNTTSTVSAGGTTVLTASSSRNQILTGSSSQTYQLPDATTLSLSHCFNFNNNSSGSLIINNAGSTLQYTVPAGGYVEAYCTGNGTANGTWDFHALPPGTVTWGSGTTGLVFNTALTTSATVAAGASSSTVPVFIPQRGSATTGFGGDSTNLYLILGGSSKFSVGSTGHITLEGVTSTGATGTGKFVFDTSPTLVTPVLGVATATSINKVALTSPATSATLTIADGKTLTVNNSITLAGTDATTITFPSTSATIARTDAAQTFTGIQTFSQIVTTPATITVTTNAGTVTRSNRINNFTNSSAATMTITMSTTGALDGDMVMVRIFDFSAVAQTITWVNTENSTVSAPTTSNGSTTLPLTVGFQYNNATSKWRCIASS